MFTLCKKKYMTTLDSKAEVKFFLYVYVSEINVIIQ